MATRSALINVMHKAATAASRGMLRDFGEVENLQVSRKGPADFVSRADINAERVIKSELQKARPDWGFVMEESGHSDGADPDAPVWIVDPLDGTTNFLHGIPHFAISIAVKDKGKITAALVFDPVRHEYFFAEAVEARLSTTAVCGFLAGAIWRIHYLPPAFLSGSRRRQPYTIWQRASKSHGGKCRGSAFWISRARFGLCCRRPL